MSSLPLCIAVFTGHCGSQKRAILASSPRLCVYVFQAAADATLSLEVQMRWLREALPGQFTSKLLKHVSATSCCMLAMVKGTKTSCMA